MDTLENLLRRVPAAYEDLEHALVRTGKHPLAGGDGNEGGSGTRTEAPPPAELDVIEHRHKLVRGLRWYCASVERRGAPVETVAAMCALLAASRVPEAEQLRQDLHAWLFDAYPFMGKAENTARAALSLPDGATDQEVRVADAAAILGCTVRTIRRRVPIEKRPGGKVRLYDALPFCPVCDLKVGAGCHCASAAQSSGVSSA